jgi:endonuclease G
LRSVSNLIMKNTIHLLALAGLSLFVASCQKSENLVNPEEQQGQPPLSAAAVYSSWPETFNTGSKTSYTSGNVTFPTGSWNLNNALLGTSSSDRKNGAQSVRIQNTGTLSMNFNLSNGAAIVTVLHGKYGTDANSTWGLYYSTNSGSTWIQTGSTITTSATSLSQASFSVNITGTIRFQVRKLSGGRLNIDDITVNDNVASGSSPTRDNNLALGNPSGAITNVGSPNNYLMTKTQYALAYNSSRGTPSWVSWHLSSAWKGAAARCDCFAADNTLPSGFFSPGSTSYSGSGFDRGHMCPSEDRDGSSTDNAATFLMTNMIPQAPRNNQITWVALENYCRTLMNAGNELYIISGGYGSGGSGSNGGTTTTLSNGNIAVPSRVWKVVVVLPVGADDVNRVSSSTRIIAIDTPNTQTVTNQTWGFYRTSVDAIEAATGLDLLSNINDSLEPSLESAVDNGPTQ